MPTSLYRFSEVQAKQGKPKHVTQLIAEVLRANDDACYIDIERFLMPPGISGSRAFDQAYAVDKLLDHDRKPENGGHISKAMQETPTLTHRVLFDYLVKVLREAGFRMTRGRLAGLLENQQIREKREEAEKEELGQPDFE